MQNQINELSVDNITMPLNMKTRLSRIRYKRAESWTFGEFEKLKKDFVDGKRIKKMAVELGRTESAVNKFLSRSGIRKNNGVKKQCCNRNNKPIKLKSTSSNSVSAKTSTQNEIFVRFEAVLSYLESKHVVITKNTENSKFFRDEDYKLGDRPASKMKLLLLANRLRLEERAPIFIVTDIIW